ncbi:hypothetical protein HXZ94_05435 [Empedobacter falsenii]|uniref:hypothetical protein n=1 Tax=Empedobacter falsenii TaxID=343874 RepID=UPI0025763EFE|nr:hypothetical protein [Empedobacter falsenii]MDM1297938.1 hypothetical protein [Empedobacter falsenii]MDM1317434.1 hypothetical protein [Empedobacter falsenii]
MYKKTLSFILLTIYTYSYADNVVLPEPCPTGDCGSGSIGTPGAQASPIDEYTIYLVGFAILMAVTYFAVKKYKKSLI